MVQQVGEINVSERIRRHSLRIRESGGECRAAVSREASNVSSGDGRDDARCGVHPANPAAFGEEHIPGGIRGHSDKDRDGRRSRESSIAGRCVLPVARDGLDRIAGSRDAPNAGISPVHHVNIPRAIDGDLSR